MNNNYNMYNRDPHEDLYEKIGDDEYNMASSGKPFNELNS